MKIFQKLLENDVQAFIEAHLCNDTARLLLKKSPFPQLEMRLIVEQIQAKRKVRDKLPSWFSLRGLIFPPQMNLEQSSSEATARFKASLASGERLADLTGGFGADSAFWADSFARVDYVEQNEELAAIAEHNFRVLGKKNIHVRVADAFDWLKNFTESLDVIYIDPARRNDAGNKLFRLSDCRPNVTALLPLAASKKVQHVWIKTSPLLDISAATAELQRASTDWHTVEIVVLAVHNECKEVLYHLHRQKEPAVCIRAVNLTESGLQSFSFFPEEEKTAHITYAMPQAFVCEPNAAVMKAGAFKTLAKRLGLEKLHPHTHLYTCGQRPENFPGRVFRLKAICKADRKAVLAHLPEPKANLTVRNFPASAAELRQRWGIAEGGNTYLFAVTLADRQKAVLIGEKT